MARSPKQDFKEFKNGHPRMTKAAKSGVARAALAGVAGVYVVQGRTDKQRIARIAVSVGAVEGYRAAHRRRLKSGKTVSVQRSRNRKRGKRK